MSAAPAPLPFDPAFLPAEPVRAIAPPAPWIGWTAGITGAVALLWFAAAELDAGAVRPATAVAAVLCAAACLALTARHTEGRERRGWLLALAGTAGAILPFVGGLAGILFGAGVVMVSGAGLLDDRHRMLDAAVAFLIVATAAAAYLYPEVAQLEGVRRTEALVAATQIVLAFSCVVFMAYRSPFAERPDAWLLAAGFVLATVTPWWEAGLPLAAALVAAGARLRTTRSQALPVAPSSGARANISLLGELALVGLVVAFVAAPPASPAVPLGLLVATLAVRHVRARLIVRENEELSTTAALEADRGLALYRSSFVALATAIEARDGYTGRHSEKTVALAESVGCELGLDHDELAHLKAVALLHDVGKIGIPDAILHKTGELSENEWRTMRRHPVIGERILRTVPGLQEVAEAVRHEHERWDGDGYPDGLTGEAIPLASRVVLVCDAWHAMTSDRPYRPRMDPLDAMIELRRCAGRQFDPRVVDALVRVVA